MAKTFQSVELHYEKQGSGLPVVLLHGFPFDHRIWRAQIDALSRDYLVIAPDLRGHGQSPVPAGIYDMSQLAGDVAALLDELGIDQAVWVGHSMGGYVTMAALREADDHVTGAALVATQPLADTHDKRVQREESAKVAEQNGPTNIAHSMLGAIFSPKVEGSDPLAQRMYEIMVDTSPTGIAGALRGMAERPDSTDVLKNASVPVLVVAGEDDQIVEVDLAREMADMIPGARFELIPDAGHMPMVEQPEQLTQALRGFLESID